MLIGISAYPRSLAIVYEYRHMFAVTRGTNHLVLDPSGVHAGNHELFVFPLLHGAATGKSVLGRVNVTMVP